jgi:dimethylhistidine N-methyltransferase
LAKSEKSLPCKYFYDGLGAKLFEQICELPEYYLTRTELGLLEELAPSLAGIVRPETALVEFGCGAGVKPRILFDADRNIEAYVPIDICGHALTVMATELARDYPDLEITPITADFTTLAELPDELRWRPLLGFFPGSTIGNLEEKDAIEFLSRARGLLGAGRLLIGIDLVKDIDTLLLAYDDPPGITAAFNKNLLLRMNNELHANFDLDGFTHRAQWNAAKSRMEMHLVSLRDQEAYVSGRHFSFSKGDAIHTENSHKYQLSQFSRLASRARWQIEKIWMSHHPRFAVLLLR